MKQSQRPSTAGKGKKKIAKNAANARELLKPRAGLPAVQRQAMQMAKKVIVNPGLFESTVLNGLDTLGSKIGSLSEGTADLAVSQTKDTIHQAVVAVEQIKIAVDEVRETVNQAKSTFETIKSTVKKMSDQVRSNPEPFIAAALPAVLALLLMAQKMRSVRAGV